MKKKRIIAALVALVSSSLVAVMSATIAWFSSKVSVTTEDNLTGSSDGSYFAYGDGTRYDDPSTLIKEGPYGIETARQLYNLAWLQYLGYFNTPKNGVITPVYFELNANIDMTGWILPPIGTSLYPFIGEFNGNGYTITNLTISNNYQEIRNTNKMPSKIRRDGSISNVNIVGMFGVIGELNNNITATYDDSVTCVKDFTIAGATIENSLSETLIGIAAGYVNGPLKNVAITSANGTSATASKITTVSATNYNDYDAFTNISDYGVVGYCEDDYLGEVTSSVTETYNATSSTYDYIAQQEGDNTGWGGSIDMKTTYDGILDAWNDFNLQDTYCSDISGTTDDGTGVYTYPATHRIVRTDNVEESNVYADETAYYRDTTSNGSFSGRYHFFTTNRKNSSGQKTSQYTFAHRSNTQRYMYLYGSYDFQVDGAMNETQVDYTTTTAKLIKIKVTTGGNTYFMTYNNGELGQTGNTNNATTWVYKDNYIYYHDDSGDNSNHYYIYNNAGTLELRNSTTYRTAFTYDSANDNYYTSYSGQNQYITYSGGEWILGYDHTGSVTYQLIQSYNYSGNYLTVTSGTTLGNTTSADAGAIWLKDDSNRYYTEINGTTYYLVYSNGVALSTSTTGAYTVNGNYLRYYDNRYNYVYYNGTTWTNYRNRNTTTSNTYRITFGTRNKTITFDYDYANSTNEGSSYKEKTTTNTTKNYSLHTQSTYLPLRQGTTNSKNYFRIYCNSNGKRYLYRSGTNSTISVTTSESTASNFVYDGKGYFPVSSDGSSGAYLRYYSTTAARYYGANYSDTTYPVLQYDGTYFTAVYNGTTYYLRYNNNAISLTNARNNASTWVLEDAAIEVPNGIPEETNTGYIIGGSNNTNKNQGNMRISQYYGAGAGDNSSIYGVSISGSGDNTKATINDIYTINGSGVVDAQKSLFGTDTPFEKSVASLEKVFAKDPNNVFGLHFMDSEMLYGSGRSVYAETATINKVTYSNYEFPQNCIDFNLKEKGYINFIAGAYFPGNNCFFTISEVQRNSSNTITNIKNIRAVYSSTNPTYSNVYLYEDGTYSIPYKFQVVNNVANKVALDGGAYTEYSTSPNLPNASYKYSLVFNCDWIDTNQSDINDDADGDYFGYPFYFEIPMNDGEYCMGSPHFTSGGQANGAYLMYLDIGANAKKVYRTEIHEYFKWIDKVYSYPKGVFVMAAGTTNASDQNSYCIRLGESYNGTLTMDRTSIAENDEAKYTGTGDASYESVSYKFPLLTLKDENNTAISMDDITPTSTTTTEIKRLTFYDYNMNTSSLNKVIITDTYVNSERKSREIEKYANYDIESQTGVADDDIEIYIVNGDTTTKVTDTSTIAVETTSNTTKILAFSTSYPTGATITITFLLNVTGTEEGGHTDYTPSGYTYTITLTRPDGSTEEMSSYTVVTYYRNSDGTYTYTFSINNNNITGTTTTPIVVTLPAIGD